MRWLWLIASAACAASAAEILPAGVQITKELSAGESQEFALPSQTGYFDLEVYARGTRLQLKAGSAWSLDLSDGPMLPVRICWIDELPQQPPLQVRSVEGRAPRSYSLKLTSRPTKPGDSDRARGCAMQTQARALRDLSKKLEVLNAARDAFQSAEDARGLAEVLGSLGETLWELGRTTDSIGSHELAVATWERIGQPGRKAIAMSVLATGYELLPGKSEQSASTFRAAMDLAKTSGDRLAEAYVLNARINGTARTNRAEEGREMAERAIALFHELGDRSGEAWAWNNLARLEQNVSLQAALAADQRALELRQEMADEIGIAQSMNNLASVYGQLGELEKGRTMLEAALEIRKRIATPIQIATTQHNLGVQYLNEGDLDRALAVFEEAMAVWRSTGYKLGEAATLTEIASTYARRGADGRAERLYREALAIDHSMKNRRAESNVLRSLGSIALRSKRAGQAAELEREAADIAHEGKFRLEETRALHILGLAHAGMNRYDDALKELAAAREIANSISRADFAAIQASFAGTLRDAGRIEESLRAYEEAEKTASELQNPLEMEGISAGKTLTLLMAGDIQGAREESRRGLLLLEDIRASLASPDARAEFVDRRHEIYHSAASALMRSGEPGAAFEASEKGRARSLADLLANTSNPCEPNQSSEERKLRAAIAAKSALLSRMRIGKAKTPEIDLVRAGLTRLQDQYASLTERLAREHPDLARAAKQVTLADVQMRLNPGEALLEFSLGSTYSYAWLVGRDFIDGVELPARERIENLVATIRKETTAEASPAAAFEKLSSLLFPDAGSITPKVLAKYRRLFVVPDGDLHFVPFAALAPLQAADLVVLPSAAILTQLPVRGNLKRGAAVFADPVYEPSDSRLGGKPGESQASVRSPDEDLRFPRLRFSERESQAIARLTGGMNATGFGASRKAFLAAPLDRFGILHFATHAVTYPSEPELSAVVLSLYDENGRPVDGFLRMYDVAKLRLNSPLVVLSACGTAVGRKLEGEGLLGISRTFLAAGASGVVATLWPVDDAATAYFMEAFYAGILKRGLPPSTALRQAQHAVQSQPRWKNPYYWAGFIYTGV